MSKVRKTGAKAIAVVGIGASAGGLEAYTALLKNLPPDTGLAFVLVQHLDPQHESALAHLLGRATSMPVREVTNNLRVKANCVHVIPPNANLALAQGILKLLPRAQTGGGHRSIDAFFESLAQDQGERAIGVLLSGTATDGTLGLEAIKAEGGITFAQDDSARYDSMPRSAVAAGCVDFVLKPEDIAKELARIANHPFVGGERAEALTPEQNRASATAHADDGSPLPSGGHGTPRTDARQARDEGEAARGNAGDNGFKKIILLLRNHCGVDFSLYKSTTIQRRIMRRVVLNKQETLEDYARFLRGNGKELDALYSDVLISVTSFFRNPEAFDVLKRKVFPKLFQQRGDEPFRTWVLGCSTGQEAYSIAMTFVEAADKAPRMRKLQVFATDLNDALLDKARHGLYAKSLAQDVSPERLRRFFVEEEGGYRINKALREMVVFARQNLIDDPPFSRMDLISCRNLLIYLEPSLQKKAFPTFHYALKPEGYLFLGASESIGGFTDLFEPADRKHKIYSRKVARTPAFHLPLRKDRGERPSPAHPRKAGTPLPIASGQREPEGIRAELNSQREADRVTVNQYAPPGVLVNAELQVLQFRGPTGAYLEPPTGKASFDVLKMAREGLMLPLRAAINKAKKEKKAARSENVRVKQNGETRTVDLEVIPLKNSSERCFLILFEDAEKTKRAGASVGGRPRGAARKPRPARNEEDSHRIVNLKRELAETRDYLQSMQEQHEAANEELQAANEEVQSANEELQSINEELETSKEELESANEELTTVNEEMASRNTELNRLNSDLVNLQTSTRLTIVLLGRDLAIRRFSSQAQKQLDLLATDVGRPIGHIRHNFFVADADSPVDLETLSAEVIASVREQEREVSDKGGRWHSLRVRPYMTLDNKVDGAVLVLVDIDPLKRSEQAAAQLAAIVTSSHDAIITMDLRGIMRSWNEGARRLFGYTAEEGIGKPATLLIPPDRFDEEPGILERIGRGETIDHYETLRRRKDGSLFDISLTISPLRDSAGRVTGAAKIARDITEQKRTEEVVRASERRLQESQAQLNFALESAHVGEWELDLTTGKARTSLRHDRCFGAAEPIPDWSYEKLLGYVHAGDRAEIDGKFKEAVAGRKDWHFDCRIVWHDGSEHWIGAHGSHYRDGEGNPTRMLGIVMDITERKQAEQRQQILKDELAHRGRNLLSVVQAMVSRSLSGTRPLGEAREVLTRRIQALARSQSVLATGGFLGGSVAEIVRLEMEPFSERVTAAGPDVILNPQAAQTFALVVHELATNATKHGALSRPPNGLITVDWAVERSGTEARFKFRWQEQGGPPITPPARKGFGSMLLETAVAQQFDAPPKISFAPEGLRYEFDALLSAVAAGSAGRGGS